MLPRTGNVPRVEHFLITVSSILGVVFCNSIMVIELFAAVQPGLSRTVPSSSQHLLLLLLLLVVDVVVFVAVVVVPETP